MTEGTKPAAVLLEEVRGEQQRSRRVATTDGLRALAEVLGRQDGEPVSTLIVSLFAKDEATARALVEAADGIDQVRTDPAAAGGADSGFFARLRFGAVHVDFWCNPTWVAEKVATRTVEVTDWTFRGQPVAVKL